MAIAVSSSLSLGHSVSHCHLYHEEGIHCSASHGIITNRLKKPHLDGFRNTLFWTGQTHWQSSFIGRDLCPWKVYVAADYSDSVPDSSNHIPNGGYHPLEELKSAQKIWETKLSSAEIAKTAVEANSDALLMFPGTVHCEPHEHITWDEFPYVVDDYGDMYFEIFDDANILEDPAASNPVIALIGMDMATYEKRKVASEYGFDNGSVDETPSDDHYYEIEEAEAPFGWGIPNTSTFVHPIYFSKCLTKVVSMGCDQKMDRPSNGVSILGCLRPAFYDEEPYVRKLFRYEDDSDWTDDENESSDSRVDRNNNGHSAIYRLEILRIELFSVYGIQSGISIQDFQNAEPDYLAHSTSTIVEHFNGKGIRFDVALKALCKKKGLHVEAASMIGVDSLGMDVRVSVGTELQTHRFPFNVRATSEVAAEKQIQQLLFPRSRRKKPRNSNQSSFRDHPASF